MNEAQMTPFSDLPGASRTVLEGAEAPVNAIRGWSDLNCLQRSHRPFSCLPASYSYCVDTFYFALWIMWAFKRFIPFPQGFIREKNVCFKKDSVMNFMCGIYLFLSEDFNLLFLFYGYL